MTVDYERIREAYYHVQALILEGELGPEISRTQTGDVEVVGRRVQEPRDDDYTASVGQAIDELMELVPFTDAGRVVLGNQAKLLYRSGLGLAALMHLEVDLRRERYGVFAHDTPASAEAAEKRLYRQQRRFLRAMRRRPGVIQAGRAYQDWGDQLRERYGDF